MAKAKKEKKQRTCTIGGQALLGGVMMTSGKSTALAVRLDNGSIVLETERTQRKKTFFNSFPLVRGVTNFFYTLVLSIKTTLKSADASGKEDEKPGAAGAFIAVFLGLLLAVGLFIVLPGFLADLIAKYAFVSLQDSLIVLFRSLIEAGIRLVLFVLYLVLVGLIKDIKHTYMYHGAEHKTINCYEKELPLTVANVQSCSTRHDRCGTSFLFFVILISIIVFALANWGFALLNLPDNFFLRIAMRLALLPFVAGISYELLKLLAKFDNPFVTVLKAPGLALQKLTTKQPTDDMAQVALTAFNAVMQLDADPSLPVVKFGQRPYKITRAEIKEILLSCNLLDELDLILSQALNVPKGELAKMSFISQQQYDTALNYAQKRAAGIPLARVTGKKEFFDRVFLLNEYTLEPRMETELVCEEALRLLGEGKGKSVLDLCCGCGCIGITIAKQSGAKLTGSDIEPKALEIAKKNAGTEPAIFVESDMFESIEGQFDLIVSNPPYVKRADIPTLSSEVKDFDPIIALDGGSDGLYFYRIIAKDAPSYLKKDGILVLEIGYNQGDEVKQILSQNFDNIVVKKDYSQNDRIVSAVVKNTAD